MVEKPCIFMDAKTKDNHLRVTSFSVNLEQCMRDYQDWVEENHLRREDIWYADIFDTITLKYLYKLEIDEGGIAAVAVPDDLRIDPFRRRRTIKQVLSVIIKRISDWFEETAWDVN